MNQQELIELYRQQVALPAYEPDVEVTAKHWGQMVHKSPQVAKQQLERWVSDGRWSKRQVRTPNGNEGTAYRPVKAPG